MKFFLTLNTKWGCQQPKTKYSPTLVQNQILARGGVSRVTPGEHLLPLPRCSPGCPGRQSKAAHCSPDNYHDGDRDHQKYKTDQFYIIVYHTECLPLAFPINRGPQFVACNQGSLIINYEDTWLRFWELVFSANCISCTSFTISTCFVSNPCTFPIGRHWQKPHIGELQLATILWLNKHCSSSADPSQLPARNWSHPVSSSF